MNIFKSLNVALFFKSFIFKLIYCPKRNKTILLGKPIKPCHSPHTWIFQLVSAITLSKHHIFSQFTCFSKAKGVIKLKFYSVMLDFYKWILSFFLSFWKFNWKNWLSWTIQTNFDSENIYWDLLINFMSSYNALKSKRKSNKIIMQSIVPVFQIYGIITFPHFFKAKYWTLM